MTGPNLHFQISSVEQGRKIIRKLLESGLDQARVALGWGGRGCLRMLGWGSGELSGQCKAGSRGKKERVPPFS